LVFEIKILKFDISHEVVYVTGLGEQQTDDFTKQNNILSANEKYASSNISVKISMMYSLYRVFEDKIG